MTKEKASIETREDYINVLEYIKAEAEEVDIEEPYIITEKYKIKVAKEWNKIYDEIEEFFDVDEDDIFANLKITSVGELSIHDLKWNIY